MPTRERSPESPKLECLVDQIREMVDDPEIMKKVDLPACASLKALEKDLCGLDKKGRTIATKWLETRKRQSESGKGKRKVQEETETPKEKKKRFELIRRRGKLLLITKTWRCRGKWKGLYLNIEIGGVETKILATGPRLKDCVHTINKSRDIYSWTIPIPETCRIGFRYVNGVFDESRWYSISGTSSKVIESD